MNENVVNLNPNSTQSNEHVTATQFTKKHLTMTSIALLVVGLGFLATGLVGLGFAYLLQNMQNSGVDSFDTLLISLTVVSSIASIVMYIVWSFRVRKASLMFQLMTIILFCISNGFAFGGIFTIINAADIVTAFISTSIILLITFAISRIMSVKTAFSIMKVMGVMVMVYFLLTLTFMIMSIFNIAIPTIGSYGISNWMYTIIIGISGIISILYITFQLFMLQKMELGRDYIDNKEARNVALYMGFTILMNLLRIFYLFVRLLGRSRN